MSANTLPNIDVPLIDTLPIAEAEDALKARIPELFSGQEFLQKLKTFFESYITQFDKEASIFNTVAHDIEGKTRMDAELETLFGALKKYINTLLQDTSFN